MYSSSSAKFVKIIIGVFFAGDLLDFFEGTAEVVPDEFRFWFAEAALFKGIISNSSKRLRNCGSKFNVELTRETNRLIQLPSRYFVGDKKYFKLVQLLISKVRQDNNWRLICWRCAGLFRRNGGSYSR